MSVQVEEVTASAQSLAEMAQKLQPVVDGFKLEIETGIVPVPTTELLQQVASARR